MRREQALTLGIDAGGTATRARGVQDGTVVHDGRGGPANPNTCSADTVRASLASALDGCPTPARIVASVAGAQFPSNRELLQAVLHDLCPAADIDVVPDYVAAFAASPPGTDVCVVAGTGSVVCSPAEDGSWRISGGYGWVLGDHGSAAQLGKAMLASYVDDPAGLPCDVVAAIGKLFGTNDRRAVVRALQTAPSPARCLASAAPLLTRAAEAGHEFALVALRDGMHKLAVTTARHITEFCDHPARVSLVGGVWTSEPAVATFVELLAVHCPSAAVDTGSMPINPLDGALLLAAQR